MYSIGLVGCCSVDYLPESTGLPKDDDYPSDESEVEDEADEDSNGIFKTHLDFV